MQTLESTLIRLSSQDDLLQIEYQAEVEINLFSAKEIMDMLVNYCQDKKYLVLEDMSNIKWIDKRSRDYFAQHPLNSQMIAWAFCSSQSIHRIMYEIYNTFSKPRGNTAFFHNKEDCLNWLSGFRNQSF